MLLLTICFVIAVMASSHSEAPGTARGPTADITDAYMFKTRRNNVALIMNVDGLSQSQAAPNYNPLPTDFVYQIHIDNDGDGYEDITYQFIPGYRQVNNGRGIEIPIQGRNVPIALQTAGVVSFDTATGKTSGINTEEYYHVRVLHGTDYSTPIEDGPFAYRFTDASKTTVSREFNKAFEHAGTKTFPAGNANAYVNYEKYVKDAAVYKDVRIPNCAESVSMFVGPRRESFGIPLGEVFDLVNIDSQAPPAAQGAPTNLFGGRPANTVNQPDSIDRFNVISFVLEIPQQCLVSKQNGRVLGMWSSVRKLEHKHDKHYATEQTSRMGNALVNELLIGVAYKNEWNSRHPSGDARYNEFLLYPTIPGLVQILFGVPAPNFPRQDLVTALHTGIPGLNKPVNEHASSSSSSSETEEVYADYIRLNLDTPYTPCKDQNRLGVIGGDAAGYPNGRRLGDDVVDITLNAAQGILCTVGLCPGNPDVSSSFLGGNTANLYTDLDDTDACAFKCASDDFPFLNPPIPGNKLFTADPLYTPSQVQQAAVKRAAQTCL